MQPNMKNARPGSLTTSHLLSTPDNIQQVQYKTQGISPEISNNQCGLSLSCTFPTTKAQCPRREEQTWAWPVSWARGRPAGLWHNFLITSVDSPSCTLPTTTARCPWQEKQIWAHLWALLLTRGRGQFYEDMAGLRQSPEEDISGLHRS